MWKFKSVPLMFKPQKGDRFEGEKRLQPILMLLSGRAESKEARGEADLVKCLK